MRGIHHSEDFSWSNAPRGSGGGGSTNTVSQSVQIPQYEQQFSSENQDLARALASNPYPAYNQPLVQGFAPQQEQGMAMAGQAASAYQPGLDASTALNAGAGWLGNGVSATQQGLGAVNDAMGTPTEAYQSGTGIMGNALRQAPNNAAVMSSYMSPYVSQALAPQILGLQTQLGQEQNKINAQATQANAFGDARQGAEQALQNFYGNQAISGVLGQGYNTAYSNALQTALQEQQLQGNIGSALTQAGNQYGQLRMGQGMDLANLGMNAANNFGQLGASAQSLGIAGANALFNAGQQQQTLGQQELNQAYQQFLNQANWPYQMLNVRESALSNSPYNMVNATTVPQANMAAQGFGSTLAGVGSLAQLLGGSGSGSNAPFGGSAYPSGR